jgi:hypothetical protein
MQGLGMAKSTISDDPVNEQDKFMLRMPAGMRDRIAHEAKQNGRSMNSEIISRLEKTLEDDQTLYDLLIQVDKLETLVHEHDEMLRPNRYDWK